MVAARSGQKKEAQYLLTQVLQDDPNEVQAWFLLSHLVDSEGKQVAYLKKVVALDPTHEKAATRLAELEAAEPLPTALDTMEMVAEAEGETAGELMAETIISTAAADVAVSAESEVAETAKPVDMEKPVEAVAAPGSEPSQAVLDSIQEQKAALTRTLLGLTVAAVIVFIILLYVIVTAF